MVTSSGIILPILIFIALVCLFIGVMKLRDKKIVFGVVMLVIVVALIILIVVLAKEFYFYQQMMNMIFNGGDMPDNF